MYVGTIFPWRKF
jgi:NhaP-type Na+/H+ or K+/H+ antiporter